VCGLSVPPFHESVPCALAALTMLRVLSVPPLRRSVATAVAELLYPSCVSNAPTVSKSASPSRVKSASVFAAIAKRALTSARTVPPARVTVDFAPEDSEI